MSLLDLQGAEIASPARASTPEWAVHLVEHARRWRDGSRADERAAAREEVWILACAGLAKYVRAHAGARLRVSADVQEDLIADKALELMQRFDRGGWDPASDGPARVMALLSAAARHGVVDLVRARRPYEGGLDLAEVASPERTDDALCRREYSSALVACLDRLRSRSRRIWMLSAFHGLTSREVAAHPDVRLSPQAVDMATHRARAALRACMKAKGLDAERLPAGCFSAVWEALEARRSEHGSVRP